MSVKEVTQVFTQPDGSIVPLSAAAPLPITFGDSGAIDAFGRLRVSNPVTLFDSQAQYSKESLLFEEVVSGGGTLTHDPDNSAVDLDVGTTSGDLAIRQTHAYFHYQPGKSQLITVTFTPGTSDANRLQEIGYGDDENGIFVQEQGGTVYVTKRSKSSGSVVDTQVAQSSWNIDPMDGTGPSGITLDFTKSHIFVADIQWLGVGRVRCGFDINGLVYYVHEFTHANEATGVYMTTANLPIRWKVENTGTASASGTLKSICCSVISEGGLETNRGYPFSAKTPAAGIGSVSTTEVGVLAIRPALTYNSITNRSTLRVQGLNMLAESAPVLFRVLYNPTIAGGTWTAANASSAMEYNNSMTGFSGGIELYAGFVSSGTNNNSTGTGAAQATSDIPFTINFDGTVGDVLLVTATRFGSSGTATVGSAFYWLEYR